MSLFDFHIELSLTNTLLLRIADALDRLSPVDRQVNHADHPLIGLADVSRMTLSQRRELDRKRDTMPITASSRVKFGNEKTAAGGTASQGAGETPASVTGSRDHDDPLDTLEEFDRPWDNYAGGV